jgi:hypothetical protein
VVVVHLVRAPADTRAIGLDVLDIEAGCRVEPLVGSEVTFVDGRLELSGAVGASVVALSRR